MRTAISTTPALPAPDRPRPGWWATIGWTLLAAMTCTVGLVAIAVALSPLHVDLSLATGDVWPWQPDTPWAVVAGFAPAVLGAAVFAVALRFAVRWTSDWQVRLLPVFAAMVVLSMIAATRPAPAGAPDDGAAAFSVLVALVVVARYAAIVPVRAPHRPPRPLVVGVAVAAVLVAVATIAYRPLHPLHAQIGDERAGGGTTWGLPADDERDPRAVRFAVENASFADARIVAIRPLAAGAPIVVQLDNTAPEFPPSQMHVPVPADGFLVGREGGDSGRVRLAPGLCAPGRAPRARLSGLLFTVETLGLRRTQRVTLTEPVLLRCPGP
jgi:hypothetical protein